jgi:hypothetical protein
MIGSKQIFSFFCKQAFSQDSGSNGIARCMHWYMTPFASICLLCLSSVALAQTQLGSDIQGEAAYDESGRAVSLSADGTHVAIGAAGNDGNGIDSGHVRVYHWFDLTWVQLGADINGETFGDNFGSSVSLSSEGNHLAVGATGNDGNGIDSGHVRIYQWSGENWEQLGANINGEAFGDYSGSSVSLSSDGSILAIGAPLNNNDNGIDSGHVRIYQWSGTSWVQIGTDIDGESPYDESGGSVSLSSDGSKVAIGAVGSDGNGIDSGHVRVYQWSGTTWTQLGDDIDGEAFGDFSGSSVSLSSNGTSVAIGAPLNINDNGIESGHTRVFHWSGEAWDQLGADIDGESPYDESGRSVSLSSNAKRLVIGAEKNDGNGFDSGHVRVYQWSGENWVQLGTDINGESPNDASGRLAALSADGNRVAIGAGRNDGNGFDAGHVRIWDLSMFNVFNINAGLNDAWYDPETDGQGFFITVFPDLGTVSLSWFTYDTELPPEDAIANLGDAGHRWMTAIGPITDNQVMMNITMTSGGIFDTDTEIERTDPPGSDGTLILTFYDCNSGTVKYDITSINRQGTVPIRRVADDNIVLCEALNAD